MNKENPKKNKKSFEYYIAQRKEEFRCQYDHERSWENLQYKLEKRRKRRISLYCVAASAALLFLILGISHIFSLQVGSINSIFYFLHKAAEPFNCLEQDNLA